jgi:hypothetical protein
MIDVLTCTVYLEEVARILIAHVVSVKRGFGAGGELKETTRQGKFNKPERVASH